MLIARQHACNIYMVNCCSAFVWLRPSVWKSLFGSSSVGAFAVAMRTLNLLQLMAVAFWLWTSRKSGLCFDARHIDIGNFVLGLMMLALGQSLVHSAFAEAGFDGLYYGAKLNGSHHRKEEESEDASGGGVAMQFKPHYVGTVLTVWAGVVVLLPQLPHNAWFVAALWSLLYAITSATEETLP